MTNVLVQIRADLKAATDPKTQKSFQRFFKEQVKYYGVKTETVGKIAKKYWPRVKTLDKQAIFALCEELYRSDYTEEAFIVSFWLPKLHGSILNQAIWQLSNVGLNVTSTIGLNATDSATTPSAT